MASANGGALAANGNGAHNGGSTTHANGSAPLHPNGSQNGDRRNSRTRSTPSPMDTDSSSADLSDVIKLYDIAPIDYASKTNSALSKSQIFRDELWRRRHTSRVQRSNGAPATPGAAGTPSDADAAVDIETVLTRNMGSDDLRRLIEHQMVEAMKLVRYWTYRESDSNDDATAEIEQMEAVLSQSSASLDVSVVQTAEFSSKKSRKRLKAKKSSKSKSSKHIAL